MTTSYREIITIQYFKLYTATKASKRKYYQTVKRTQRNTAPRTTVHLKITQSPREYYLRETIVEFHRQRTVLFHKTHGATCNDTLSNHTRHKAVLEDVIGTLVRIPVGKKVNSSKGLVEKNVVRRVSDIVTSEDNDSLETSKRQSGSSSLSRSEIRLDPSVGTMHPLVQ